MNPRWRTVSIVATLITLIASLAFLSQKEWTQIIETDVSTLLPNNESTASKITRTLVSEKQGRGIYIIIENLPEHEETQARVNESFLATLRQSPRVDSIDLVDQSLLNDLFRYVAQNKLHLTFPKWFSIKNNHYNQLPSDGRPTFEEWAAASAVEDFDNFLESPEAMQLGEEGLLDPLLLNITALKNFSATQSSHPKDTEATAIKYWLTLNTSPLSVSTQDDIELLFNQAQSSLQEIAGSDIKIRYGGLLRLAAASRTRIQNDVVKINLLSLIGVISIVSIFIRKPWILLKALPIIVFALIGSFTSCVALFGSVHVIVMVIGSIIIGISIDYAFHAIFESKDSNSTRKLLFFAALSTIAGSLTFLSSDLPLIRQIGAFTATGLFFAFLYSLTLKRHDWEQSKGKEISSSPQLLTTARVLIIAAIITSIYGFTQISWSDDIRNMEAAAPELLKEDLALREQFASTEDTETLLVTGNSYLEVLQHADDFTQSINNPNTFSLSTTLSTQSEVQALTETPYNLTHFFDSLNQAFENAGYDTTLFDSFFNDVTSFVQSPIIPQTFEDKVATLPFLLNGPFAGLIDSDESLYWTILRIENREFTERPSHIVKLSSLEFINESLNGYRSSLFTFGISAISVVCILILSFFGFKKGIRIVLVPGISVLITLGFAAIVFDDLNIFHLAGCFLAMALSLDYALFSFDAFNRKRPIPFSVWLSAATTGASFLALNISAISVVRSLGFVVCLNTVITLILLLALSSRYIRLSK